MKLNTTIHNEFNNKDWDDLLQKIPTSTAFQMSYNYDPYKMAFDSKPLYIIVQDTSGKILGQLLVVQHFKNLTREPDTKLNYITSKFQIGSIITWHYGPIIHDDENVSSITSSMLDALNKYCHKNKVLLSNGSLTTNSNVQEQNQFLNYNYQNNKWDTWITNLDVTLDSLYNSLHNKTRYDIRKAEKNDLTFEICSDRSILDEWMKIKFFGNKNLLKLIKKYEKFNDYNWEILYKNGYEKIFVTRLGDDLISGIANKLFNKNVVQHSIINSQTKLQGGSYLTWNSIKWSKENNFLTYDVGGANPSPTSTKEKGIRHFKSKWNGEKKHYFLVRKVFDKNKLKLFRIINSPELIKSKLTSSLK